MFWEHIPLNDRQGKEEVFVVILTSVELSIIRGVVPGRPICELFVIGKGHGHETINNFVEEAEAGN